MKDVLQNRNVSTEFIEIDEDVVRIGYNSNKNDAAKMFDELQVVVNTVLEHGPGGKIEGVVFHTEHSVIGLWGVDEERADRRRAGEISEVALGLHVLRSFRILRFG